MSDIDGKIIKPEGVHIAALVPAFNEERNIRRTIRFLLTIGEIDEIIVINDGSEDRTAQVVREECGVTLVDLERNQGKGGALRAGLESTSAEVILMLDADLLGMARPHVAALLAPVLDGRAKATMGVFRDGRMATDIAQLMAPGLSGQRAIRRELLAGAPIDDARYGIEVALNRHLEELGVPIFEVELVNVSQVVKEEKLGLVRGFAARMNMYYEVIKMLVVGK
jgi:polyisoprenyl-phosphate glycosyltransferase